MYFRFLFYLCGSFIQIMEKTYDAGQPLRSQINDLEIGDAVGFPIDRIDYVLSCRTRLQQTTGKKFSSRIDGETVFITREKENTPEEPGNL